MQRASGGRIVAGIVALASFGLVYVTAAALASSGTSPRLTEAQKKDVQLDLTNAVAAEHIAFREIKRDEFRVARGTLVASQAALDRAEGVLAGHDLGGSNVPEDIHDAIGQDLLARASLSPRYRFLAEAHVKKAIQDKNSALHLLPQVPTQENPISTFAVCAFSISSDQVGVEVQGTPGETGGVRVADASGTQTDAKTFVEPSTGLAIVAPLTAPTTGSIVIAVFLGSHTTSFTKPAGGTPQSTCTPSPTGG